MPTLDLDIPPHKIILYLLDPNGKDPSKARFFLGRGFDVLQWLDLSNALAEHAANGWPGTVKSAGDYGVKHIITGPLQCPDGTSPDVLSVWQFKPGATAASFITAYPNN